MDLIHLYFHFIINWYYLIVVFFSFEILHVLKVNIKRHNITLKIVKVVYDKILIYLEILLPEYCLNKDEITTRRNRVHIIYLFNDLDNFYYFYNDFTTQEENVDTLLWNVIVNVEELNTERREYVWILEYNDIFHDWRMFHILIDLMEIIIINKTNDVNI